MNWLTQLARKLRISILALPALLGCGPNTQPQNSNAGPQLSNNGQATSFKIDQTDFGIDVEYSKVELDRSDPEQPTVSVTIAGNQKTFEALTVDEDAEWSWSLSPPEFRFEEVPITLDPATKKWTAAVEFEDVDDYEFSILMMNYNSLHAVRLTIDQENTVEIAGRVDMFGEMKPFAIRWEREADSR